MELYMEGSVGGLGEVDWQRLLQPPKFPHIDFLAWPIWDNVYTLLMLCHMLASF